MIPLSERHQLPERPGIYVVYNKDQIAVYVGQSKNLKSRWTKPHHQLYNIVEECGSEIWLDWVEAEEWMLNRIENDVFNTLKPKLNRKSPPFI